MTINTLIQTYLYGKQIKNKNAVKINLQKEIN